MFVFNTMTGDLRVHRQASRLAREGYEVRVYAFLEQGLPEREQVAGYTIFREDQRPALTRFLDDRVSRLWRRSRPVAAPQERAPGPVEEPPDRPPVRPCPEPSPRRLPPDSTPEQRNHRDYVRTINRVWAEQAARFKPHICQAHDLDALQAAAWCAERSGAALIYDTHELWTEQPYIDTQEAVAYWNALEAELIGRCQAVLTVNAPIARRLEQAYGLERVWCLYNCQEWAEGDPARERALRRKFQDRPVALYQGVYAPDRGLEQLIASTRYQDQVVVALRGFGDCEPELRALNERCGGRAVFLERVASSEIVAAASEADITVIPFLPTCLNHYLATPNKLFESMMAGVPVAAADLPDLAWFVQEEGLGTLFDPYSPSDIARALVELSGRDLAALSAHCRRRCRERWNWEREGEVLVECYRQVLAPANSGP